jgi:imidazole glycerol phosphate synthase subunit HisF
MTLARRTIVILDLDSAGLLTGTYADPGYGFPNAGEAARQLAARGADEIWLRMRRLGRRGVGVVFDPIRTLKRELFMPLVVWAQDLNEADARLLLRMGADRVVVDLGQAEPPPELDAISRLIGRAEPDRMTAALVVRRLPEAQRRWEAVDVQGRTVFEDVPLLINNLRELGVAEVVVQVLCETLPIPVIAATGRASVEEVVEAFLAGADGVASDCLFGPPGVSFQEVKEYSLEMGVAVRPPIPPYVTLMPGKGKLP